MIEELEKIGLTKGEAKVYLSLFDLKEGTKYSIAGKAKVSASKVYEILDRLIKKGLVSYVIKNNVKKYYPANPDKLKEYLDKKEEEISKGQDILRSLLPALNERSKTNKNFLKVKVYEGYNGIKSVLEEIKKEFDSKSEWFAMGIRSSKKEIYNNLWIQFHKERAKNKINCKFMFTDKGTYFYKELSSLPCTDTRVIKQITPSGVAIYKSKIIIFSYANEDSAGILIEDNGTADSFREFFKGIWKLAKP
jgi:sugar-specific transcriptional regulator TrmB